MESESGENVEYFWILRKLLLVRFCGYFSVSCHPYVWRHSVIPPVHSTKKLLKYSVVLVPAKEKEWEIECDTRRLLFCHRLDLLCPVKDKRNNVVEV